VTKPFDMALFLSGAITGSKATQQRKRLPNSSCSMSSVRLEAEIYLVNTPGRTDAHRACDWPYVTQLPCEPAIFKIACTSCLHVSEDEGAHGFHAHDCDGNTVIVFVPIGMEKSAVFDNQEILGRI